MSGIIPIRGSKSPTILVADPDGLMRWAVVERLSGLGYTIHEASQPMETMAGLQRAPDIAIVDLIMLGGRHGDLAAELAAFSRGRGVILTTSDPSADLPLTVDVRASDVLKKPFDLDTLASVVNDVLTPLSR